VRYIDETYASSANTQVNDSYSALDLSVQYELGNLGPALRGTNVSLKGTNVNDDRRKVCNGTYCYLGDGRSVIAELKYTW
jgi:iron complex outermembrane receptor protein